MSKLLFATKEQNNLTLFAFDVDKNIEKQKRYEKYKLECEIAKRLGICDNIDNITTIKELENILSQFKNDLCSLHSCLLVNRYWCQLVIPLLWSQPFELVKETSSHKIIRTLISCLPKETKKRFFICNICFYTYL